MIHLIRMNKTKAIVVADRSSSRDYCIKMTSMTNQFMSGDCFVHKEKGLKSKLMKKVVMFELMMQFFCLL